MTSEHASGIPFDDGLPGASLLLDVDKMRPHVQSSFGLFGRVSQVQIRQVDYQPHHSLRVHYLAEIGTYRHDLTAQIGFGPADKTLVAALKVQAKERKSARTPIIRLLTEGEAYLSWWPIDLGLPILARTDVEIADLIGMDSAGPSVRLSWAPGRSAVLRFPQAVVKVYADPTHALKAATALKVIADHVPTSRLLYRNVDEGLIGTELLVGQSLDVRTGMDHVGAAVDMLQHIHGLDTAVVDPNAALPVHDASKYLDELQQSTSVIAFCRPDLSERIAALLTTLRNSAPTDAAATYVVSHGNFDISQLIRTSDQTRVLAFDHLCRAPRALDVAQCAVNQTLGHSADHAKAVELLGALLSGYGADVPGIEWYTAAAFLGRLAKPLTQYQREWSARVEAILNAAEVFAAG